LRIADFGLRIEDIQSTIRNLRSEIALRLGLRMVNGLAETAGKVIERARCNGPFISIDDFARRTRFGQPMVKRLAAADPFRSVGASRRQALWQSLAQEHKPRCLPLFIGNHENEPLPTALPAMQLNEEVVADYRSAGLSLRAHPISFYRDQLDRLSITPAKKLAKLADGVPVRVAGLVLLRQRPGTAKGITFVTLEDETGTINLVIHQRTWDRYYRIARGAPAWIAHGHLQSADSVIHVVVRRLEPLAEQLRELDVKARDFR
jgi:error-prone DNA polymerase